MPRCLGLVFAISNLKCLSHQYLYLVLPEVDLAGRASIDPLGPETLGPALESFVAQFHEHFSYLCIYIERH